MQNNWIRDRPAAAVTCVDIEWPEDRRTGNGGSSVREKPGVDVVFFRTAGLVGTPGRTNY